MTKVYVATSWKNDYQPAIVKSITSWGYDVYDFRHPVEGNDGFHWSNIDIEYRSWDVAEYRKALEHPLAIEGFMFDMEALDDADIVVLVTPSGRSAHVEAAYHKGKGKPVILCIAEYDEPDLMYKMFNFITCTEKELEQALKLSSMLVPLNLT